MLPWWTGPPCTARDVERLKVLKLEALGLQSTSKEMGTNGKGSRYLHIELYSSLSTGKWGGTVKANRNTKIRV